MWKSLLAAVAGVVLLPFALYGQGQCMAGQGGMQHGQGQGMQMGMQHGQGQGMQMGGGGQGMMQRNFVRDLLAERATLDLSAAQVEQLEPLAQRLDDMMEVFQGMHRSGVGMTLTPAARDSMRTTHTELRRTNEEEVLREVKAVLGPETYMKGLELLVVRRGPMN